MQDQTAIKKDNWSSEEKGDGWSTREMNTIRRKHDLAIGPGDRNIADTTVAKDLTIGQENLLRPLAIGTTLTYRLKGASMYSPANPHFVCKSSLTLLYRIYVSNMSIVLLHPP